MQWIILLHSNSEWTNNQMNQNKNMSALSAFFIFLSNVNLLIAMRKSRYFFSKSNVCYMNIIIIIASNSSSYSNRNRHINTPFGYTMHYADTAAYTHIVEWNEQWNINLLLSINRLAINLYFTKIYRKTKTQRERKCCEKSENKIKSYLCTCGGGVCVCVRVRVYCRQYVTVCNVGTAQCIDIDLFVMGELCVHGYYYRIYISIYCHHVIYFIWLYLVFLVNGWKTGKKSCMHQNYNSCDQMQHIRLLGKTTGLLLKTP